MEIKIRIDSTTKHNIKNPTCTLSNLKDSLDSLPDVFRRIDGPEYLCVNDKNFGYTYIDLSNSVVYSIIDGLYLCKRFKNGDTLIGLNFRDESFYNTKAKNVVTRKKLLIYLVELIITQTYIPQNLTI